MKDGKSWMSSNGLLAKLPAAVCARLTSDLRLVQLPVGKVLYESGAQQEHIYFPRSGIVSLLYVLENGDAGEIAMVGNEGLVGTAVLVDSQSTPSRAVVQIAGEALALGADAVDREFKLGGEFQFVLLRYTQALIAQMAQTAICNRHHPIEKQLCRWLLLCLDRLEADELNLTQEAIANLLGVRREGITEAAGRLQEAGLIRYSRGNIRVLDRKGLEQRSCECYRAVESEYDRLLDRRSFPEFQ
jgi:CRP-like cAMP-binding protein